MKKNFTVCIAGKNEIAVFGAQQVLEKFPQIKIICLPNSDDPGFDTWQPSLKRFALSNKIQIVDLQDCYSIKDLIFISLEFNKIIKPPLFKTKLLYNIHFSKLPKYRGMFTSSLPLLFGEKESGVTLHEIDSGIDTGNIIDQISFNLDDIESARQLYFRYLAVGKKLFLRNLKNVISGQFTSHPQSKTGESYFSKKSLNYSNISIDFNKSSFEVKNQIRAFIFQEYQLPNIYGWDINQCSISSSRSRLKAGSIIKENQNELIVSTKDNNVNLSKDYYNKVLKACVTNNVNDLKKINLNSEILERRNKKGETPLMIALNEDAVNVASHLIRNGAIIDVEDYRGNKLDPRVRYLVSKARN